MTVQHDTFNLVQAVATQLLLHLHGQRRDRGRGVRRCTQVGVYSSHTDSTMSPEALDESHPESRTTICHSSRCLAQLLTWWVGGVWVHLGVSQGSYSQSLQPPRLPGNSISLASFSPACFRRTQYHSQHVLRTSPTPSFFIPPSSAASTCPSHPSVFSPGSHLSGCARLCNAVSKKAELGQEVVHVAAGRRVRGRRGCEAHACALYTYGHVRMLNVGACVRVRICAVRACKNRVSQ